MKLKLIAMVALAACTAAAMPTRDEIAKANQEVRKSLKAQIAAWKDGKLSDGELASLMLAHSRKFTDEARRYACLQTAFAAAVRAGDAVTAANALARLADEIKGFDGAAEKAILDKSLAKADDATAKSFRYRLEAERARLSSTPHVSAETAATIARMKTIVVPSLDIKADTTFADAVDTLRELGRKCDSAETPEDEKGFKLYVKGVAIPVPEDKGPEDAFETRRFPAQALRERFATMGVGDESLCRVFAKDWLKPFASLQGWPEGSDVSFDRGRGELVVKSTRKSLDFVGELLGKIEGQRIPMPEMPAISTGEISFYDAVKTVTASAGLEFKVDGGVVCIFPDTAKILRANYEQNKAHATAAMADAKRLQDHFGNVSRALFEGKRLAIKFQKANLERSDLGIGFSVWPRTVPGTGADEEDIAGL